MGGKPTIAYNNAVGNLYRNNLSSIGKFKLDTTTGDGQSNVVETPLLESAYFRDRNNLVQDYNDRLLPKPKLSISNEQIPASDRLGLDTMIKINNTLNTNFDNTLKTDNSRGKGNPKRSRASWLRYSPIIGSTLGLAHDIFSKPDYAAPEAIEDAANQLVNYTPVDYNPLGNYLQYRPFDRDFYISKLNAQSGATRSAIINQSNNNRAAAIAGLLAADYNAQGRLGDLARQAEEYNLAQREKVESFNRGTNASNAEMGLKAAMANQEAALKARTSRLSGLAQAMTMRDAIDSRRGASMSANLTNLFDSLGNIGREEYTKDMIRNSPGLLYDWLGRYKAANGGYLTVNKKIRRK